MQYFKLHEFDSPDVPGSGARMNRDFLELLDEARGIAGVPFRINSGYRTQNHNASISGASTNSSHLRGLAADISCTTSTARFRIIAALIAVGFTRLGIHNGFIHVDNDSLKSPGVTWLYA
jgi:uncharacterized protein YcbK (DUF882 family)